MIIICLLRVMRLYTNYSEERRLMMSDEYRDVEVEKKEKKSDPSKVGVAAIKYIAYLIIFFGILWFLINYVISPLM